MYHKCDEGLNLRTTIGGLQRNKKRKKNGIDTGSTECISYLDLEGKGKKRYGVLWYLGERWYELGQNQVFVLNALKHWIWASAGHSDGAFQEALDNLGAETGFGDTDLVVVAATKVRNVPDKCPTSEKVINWRSQLLHLVFELRTCISQMASRQWGRYSGNTKTDQPEKTKNSLQIGAAAMETVGRFLKNLRIGFPDDPAITLSGIHLEKMKTLIWKDTCTLMFRAAQFTIAKTWKQPKCPSTDEWIKMWYVYTVEYYCHKENEILPVAATWMNLEIIILTEVSQTEEHKYYMISLTGGIWKVIQVNLFTK